MKKIILCLFATGFLMVACSKKENTIGGNPNLNSSTISNAKEKPGGPNSTMTQVGPAKGWCNGYPWNCTVLPDVVITAGAKAILDYNCDIDSPYKAVQAFTDTDEGIQDILSSIPQAYEDSLLSYHY